MNGWPTTRPGTKRLLSLLHGDEFSKIVGTFIKSYAIVLLVFFSLATGLIWNAKQSSDATQDQLIRDRLGKISSYFDAHISYIQFTASQLSLSPQIRRLYALGRELNGVDHYDIYMAEQALSSMAYGVDPLGADVIQDVFIYAAKPGIIISPTTTYGFDYFVNRQYNFGSEAFLEDSAEALGSDRSGRFISVESGGKRQYFYFLKLTSWPLDADCLIIVAFQPQAITQLFGSRQKGNSYYLASSLGETVSFDAAYRAAAVPAYGDLPGASGKETRRIGGTRSVVTWYQSLPYGFKYVNIKPVAVYYSGTTAIERTTLLYSVLLCLLGIITTFAISVRRYRSFAEIIQAISGASDGIIRKRTGTHNPQLDQINAGLDRLISQNRMLSRSNSAADAMISSFRKELEQNHVALREDFIHKLMTGQIEEEIAPEMLSIYSIRLANPFYVSLIIQIDALTRFETGSIVTQSHEATLEKKRARAALTGFVGKFFEWESLTCSVGQDTVGMIVNLPGPVLSDPAEQNGREPEEHVPEERVRRMAESFRDYALEKLNIQISVGIGCVNEGIAGCTSSYLQAVQALGYRIYLGKGTVICYSDIAFAPLRYYYSIEEEMHLTQHIRNGNENGCFEVLNRIFTRNLSNTMLDIKAVNLLFLDMMRLVTRVAYEIRPMVPEDRGGEGMFESLMQSSTVQEMKDSVFNVYAIVCRRVKSSNSDDHGRRGVIHSIVKYINENYTDKNLNQLDVADRFSLAAPVLSVQYKREVGMNMWEHINFLRVKKVKQILDSEKSVLISDAAERSGFTNVKTLIRVFKKFEGVTPGTYRRLHPEVPEAASSAKS